MSGADSSEQEQRVAMRIQLRIKDLPEECGSDYVIHLPLAIEVRRKVPGGAQPKPSPNTLQITAEHGGGQCDATEGRAVGEVLTFDSSPVFLWILFVGREGPDQSTCKG